MKNPRHISCISCISCVYISKKDKTALVQPPKPGSNTYSAGSSKSQSALAGVSVLFCYGFNTDFSIGAFGQDKLLGPKPGF